MEIRQLRYVVALAEHGQVTKAAQALGMAQPSLSRQVAALERELGLDLFDRHGHGVEPTVAGQVFVGHARRLLDALAVGVAETRRAGRGRAVTLRVGFTSSALAHTLPTLLTRLRRDHPEIRFECREMSTGLATGALLGGEIDVAVARGGPLGVGAEHLTSIPIEQDHLVLLCPSTHPFSSRSSVTHDQLRGEPLIVTTTEDEPAVLATLRRLCGPLESRSTTVARDLHTKFGLAACGLGIGPIPAGSSSLAPPGTCVVELRPTVPLPDLNLVIRAGDDAAEIAALLAAAAAVFPRAGRALTRHRI